ALDDGGDVRDEQAHVVAVDALRLVAQVVATLVDRDHLISVCERGHLVPPRVPEIRKPVDHDDQRPLAERGVMDLHAAVRRRVAVLDAVENVAVSRQRRLAAQSESDQSQEAERNGGRHDILLWTPRIPYARSPKAFVSAGDASRDARLR